MKRSTTLAATLLLSASLIGCGLEGGPVGDGGGGGDGGDLPNRIPSPEEGQDDRLDALGIVCESKLALTGTFTPQGTPPAGEDDCWPVGQWSFTAGIDFQGCDPQEQLTETYVYDVLYNDDDAQFEIYYAADPDNERMNLKLTFDSSGMCLGGFEHFRDDNVVLTFKPIVDLAGTMTGAGSYSLFSEDPF